MYTFAIVSIALFLTLSNCHAQLIYKQKSVGIGNDKVERVQKTFHNHLNIDYEKRDTIYLMTLNYVDIKEPSFTVKKIVITSSIFFEFSPIDSVLQKIDFVFEADNPLTRPQLNQLLNRLSQELPVFAHYLQHKTLKYRWRNVDVFVRIIDDDDQTQVLVTTSLVSR